MAEAAGEVGLIQEASRLLERARELQESAASLISTAKKDEQSLCQRAQVLESEFHRLRRSVDAAAKTRAVDAATVDKVSVSSPGPLLFQLPIEITLVASLEIRLRFRQLIARHSFPFCPTLDLFCSIFKILWCLFLVAAGGGTLQGQECGERWRCFFVSPL